MSTITKKKFIIPVLGLMIVCGLVFMTTSASAELLSTPNQTLVSRIAKKFGLSESQVQAVFDEDRKERHSKMEAEFTAKLDEAVKSGKLTATQKQLILDKHQELELKHDQRMEGRQELKAWAEKNNIELDYLFRGGKHRGPPTKNY